MQVTISNHGEDPVRVIVDGDQVNDSLLEAGESQKYETPPEGKIELRAVDEADES